MKERRACPRIKKEALAFYNIVEPNGETKDEGMAKILDLSEEGLHIELPKPSLAGDLVQLTVSLGEGLFNVQGSVIWIARQDPPFEVGIKADWTEGDYLRLVSLLES